MGSELLVTCCQMELIDGYGQYCWGFEMGECAGDWEVAYEAGVLQAGDYLRGQASCLMGVSSRGRCLVRERRVDGVSHGDWIAS
jgi:hypothetical protein